VTTSPFTVRSFDDVFEQGVRFRTSGDYATSLAAFSKAAQLTKVSRQLSRVMRQRGIVFVLMGIPAAEKMLNEAIYQAYRNNDLAEVYRLKRDVAWIEMSHFEYVPHRRLISLLYLLFPWVEPFGVLGKAHMLLRASLRGFEQLGDKHEALVTRIYLAMLERLRLHRKHAEALSQL
jgi:hypothetical protein